jgi:hypothetical protein
MGKKKVTLSVESRIYDDFRKYCENNAIMLSKRLEMEMQKIMKRGEEK